MDETDRLFPQRSIGSDGSLGDQAHAARESDHNPSGGYVHAVDLTDDDTHRCDVGILLANLVATKDGRIKYLIHKGTIWKSYASSLPAWTPSVYTGINAHEKHLHISVSDGQEDATGPWWPTAPDPPPTTKEDDDMFTYEYKDSKGGNHLVAVGGGVQISLTGQTLLTECRKKPNHYVIEDAGNRAKLVVVYGPIS